MDKLCDRVQRALLSDAQDHGETDAQPCPVFTVVTKDSLLDIMEVLQANQNGHMIILSDSIAPFCLQDVAALQNAGSSTLPPNEEVTDCVRSSLDISNNSTCLNLKNCQILTELNSESSANLCAVICKSQGEDITRPGQRNVERVLMYENVDSSSPDTPSSTTSSNTHMTYTQVRQSDPLARVIRYIMRDDVSVNIDMTFLEKANSIGEGSLKRDWARIKSVLPYCKHTYMQLFQVRKLIGNLAHLCTGAFRTAEDINVEEGLLYTNQTVFDLLTLRNSDNIEDKLRFMNFRGVQQPNSEEQMRRQLKQYWPDPDVHEAMLEDLMEEARLDFFTVVNDVMMSLLWSKASWKFKDIDKISSRMHMSRTSLCSSDAFTLVQSNSSSSFSVMPLFVGVDVDGNVLNEGREGAVHYVVNSCYMSLIEKTVVKIFAYEADEHHHIIDDSNSCAMYSVANREMLGSVNRARLCIITERADDLGFSVLNTHTFDAVPMAESSEAATDLTDHKALQAAHNYLC
eukprot:5265-Heterococcus_DN1.PRE.29